MTQIFIKPPESALASTAKLHYKIHDYCRKWAKEHPDAEEIDDAYIEAVIMSDPEFQEFFESDDGKWVLEWCKTNEGKRWHHSICRKEQEERGLIGHGIRHGDEEE